MESAGGTLIKGDLRGILCARKLSRQTIANIRQNLFFAFAYNTAGVPIAAGFLYPFLPRSLTEADETHGGAGSEARPDEAYLRRGASAR